MLEGFRQSLERWLKKGQENAFALSLGLSLALHGVLLLPGFSLAAWEAIDPDLLGLRGGKQWAEKIALTAPPEQEAPYETLEVRIVTALPPEEEALEKREEEIAEEIEKSPEEETKSVLVKAPRAPGDHADTPSEATKPDETETAALQPGLDARGQNEGGSDHISEGSFVSGKEMALLLAGWTLRGSNGFLDGSIEAERDARRQSIPWRVYYGRGGHLRAQFSRHAAAYPHGPIALRDFSSSGRWWVKGDRLCQRIEKWFYGSPICFEIRRDGKALAMYYAECGGAARCYQGRLGPEGIIVKGRHFQ